MFYCFERNFLNLVWDNNGDLNSNLNLKKKNLSTLQENLFIRRVQSKTSFLTLRPIIDQNFSYLSNYHSSLFLLVTQRYFPYTFHATFSLSKHVFCSSFFFLVYVRNETRESHKKAETLRVSMEFQPHSWTCRSILRERHVLWSSSYILTKWRSSFFNDRGNYCD